MHRRPIQFSVFLGLLAISTSSIAASVGTYSCRTDGFASFGAWPSGPGARPSLQISTPEAFSQFLMTVTDAPNSWCDKPEPLTRTTSTRWWQCRPLRADFNREFPISILRGSGFGSDLESHDGSTRLFITSEGRFTLTSISGSLVMVGKCVNQ